MRGPWLAAPGDTECVRGQGHRQLLPGERSPPHVDQPSACHVPVTRSQACTGCQGPGTALQETVLHPQVSSRHHGQPGSARHPLRARPPERPQGQHLCSRPQAARVWPLADRGHAVRSPADSCKSWRGQSLVPEAPTSMQDISGDERLGRVGPGPPHSAWRGGGRSQWSVW